MKITTQGTIRLATSTAAPATIQRVPVQGWLHGSAGPKRPTWKDQGLEAARARRSKDLPRARPMPAGFARNRFASRHLVRGKSNKKPRSGHASGRDDGVDARSELGGRDEAGALGVAVLSARVELVDP